MADSTTFTGLTNLNLSGAVAANSQAVTTAATITALDSSKSVVIISGSTSAIALQGIVAGIDGQMIDVINLGTGALTFTHQSGGASADQITCLTGSSQSTTGAGAGRLIYNTTSSKWILVSIQA